MKEKTKYQENVEIAGEIRNEINSVHFKRMAKLAAIFENFFGCEPQEFKNAKDLIYYQGGWPNANTPPRAESMAERITKAYAVLALLGEEEQLNECLAKRGFTLKPISDNFLEETILMEAARAASDDKKRTKVRTTWMELFDTALPSDPVKVLRKLMDEALSLQGTICHLADEIKLEMGSEVEAQCGIRVTDFTKAVSIQAKKVKLTKDEKAKQKVAEAVDRRVKESISITDSVSIFT